MIVNALFWGFSGLLLLSAMGVIIIRHPVKSVLCLVLCFFAAAALWLLLAAEFLALLLLLVYVGAVMTLFLFVVMTIPKLDQATKTAKFYLPIAILMAVLLAAILVYVLPTQVPALSIVNAKIANVHVLGNILYTIYALPFEMAAVILLAAMIAAISLTLYDPIRRKQQSIEAQIKVQAENRIQLIK